MSPFVAVGSGSCLEPTSDLRDPKWFRVAVWRDDLRELHERGLISGVSLVTEYQVALRLYERPRSYTSKRIDKFSGWNCRFRNVPTTIRISGWRTWARRGRHSEPSVGRRMSCCWHGDAQLTARQMRTHFAEHGGCSTTGVAAPISPAPDARALRDMREGARGLPSRANDQALRSGGRVMPSLKERGTAQNRVGNLKR
jgi:hypothetical protein